MSDMKAALLSAQWQKHDDAKITVNGEEVAVIIRRPPLKVICDALEKAQKAGEMDENRQLTSESMGVRFLARIVCLTLFVPGAIRPLFTEEDLHHVEEAPWLLEVQAACTAAVAHAGVVIEAAKGN
jgi:hypothetical protein